MKKIELQEQDKVYLLGYYIRSDDERAIKAISNGL
jgi:hypothetical protein